MLFGSLNLNIAINYLRWKTFEGIVTIFSLIGVVLGVATLVVVTSVMNGFYIELQKHVIGINGHIEIVNHQDYSSEKILQLVGQFPEIKHIAPVIQKQSLISNENNTLAILSKGMSLEALKKQEKIVSNILDGDIEQFEDGIMIGNQIAGMLNVGVGDKVKIIAPETNNTIIGQIPLIKTYKIIAIFSFGMYEYDSTVVYMPFASASKLYRLERPNLFEIYLYDENNAQKTSRKLAKAISLPVQSWQEKQSSYFNALKTERSVMFIILSLIVVVASFNIISTLIILVEDKKKSIAILRTMGISKLSIVQIFIMCGMVIGLVGTIFGIGLGLIFAHYINEIKSFIEALTGSVMFEPSIYFFTEIPTVILGADIIKIASLAICSALVATIIPAKKAASTSPAKALSYE